MVKGLKIMKIYVAGPITGMEDGNRAAFAAAERMLVAAGFEVVNPQALKLPLDVDWYVAMRKCVALLVECDGVALLDGWDRSDGALVENWIAGALQIRAGEVEWWVERGA